MPITIKPTQLKYKDPSTSQYVSVVAAAEGGSSNVDVQINGTSILSNGVANIPIITTAQLGVCSIDSDYGISANSNGRLYINKATSTQIPLGIAQYRPIVPYNQHESVFYGLAKAAGDSTQAASSNEVGVYTNNAKTAIQNMLNVLSATDPVIVGSISQDRLVNSPIGYNSIALGESCQASGSHSLALGYQCSATGPSAHAEGYLSSAGGPYSVSMGLSTVSMYQTETVIGRYNSISRFQDMTSWESGVSYSAGDKVWWSPYILICKEDHTSSGTEPPQSLWLQDLGTLFVVGNGLTGATRSNALTLTHEGKLLIADYLYVGANANGEGGYRVPHDIQINGTSIVNNGVANIPIASSSTIGAVKTATAYGTAMIAADGIIKLEQASSAQIKAGTQGYKPIVPEKQHEAVFYGLAKAAGDSTQSASSNAVGVYTDNAKSVIQNMLSVLSINDPIFTGSLSCGRTANSYSGPGSIAIGTNIVASGYGSIGFGYESEATGSSSIAGGHRSEAIGSGAIAVGTYNIAIYDNEVVLGRYNFVPTYDDWADGTEYEPGDIVKYNNNIYKCYETTDSAIPGYSSNWRPYTRNLLTVGNGGYIDDRSNALTLTIDGDLYLHKDLYINADISGNNGSKVATEAYVSTSIGNIILPTKVSDLTNDSGFLTSVPTMTGATASTNGTSGLVPAPTSGDIYKFLSGDGTYRSGGLPMVILSYGNSTWSDFIEAYNNNVIVYCRASSNTNPKTGSQTRMAFMAYVNNETTPTNVEFQYYRSMSSHSGTQMGDQVYVYKLDKTSGWSVTVREAGLKEIEFDASTGLTATWNNNKLTITTI